VEDKIIVDKSILVNKGGRPTTIQARRKSQAIKGKVRGKRNHFTDKEKMNAVCIFAVSGNSRRVAELSGIPEGTIRSWKCTEWWNEILTRIHVEEDEELDTKLTKLVNKAVEAVNERLDEGDWIYNPKLDKLIRKPVNAKDLAIVTAITVDKRQLLRGQPTARIEKISQDERLNKLALQFKQFTLAKEVVQDATQVGQIEESNIIEYQERDAQWETTEASNSNSNEQSGEESEEEEKVLTVNELFAD